MSTEHTYETTYETERDGIVVGSAEVRLTYTFSPGSGETYNKSVGGPGGWEPGYGPEIEIFKIEEEHGGQWGEVGSFFYDILHDWAETSLFDTLIEAVGAEYEARRDEAADARYEAQRDRRMMQDE